ncbi:MAG: alpha/beta fold hydrolase [Azospirillaceae bacterium]
MGRDLDIGMDDGCRLRLRIDGREGAGSWVVMANSILTDMRVWDAQVPALAERHRVLRFDQRGHGRSDASGDPLDFDRLGADLLALLNRCGVEAAHFVGLSMGVPTVLAALAGAPERFRSVVCVDGHAANRPGGEAFWSGLQKVARDQGMGALAAATVARWLKPGDAQGTAGRQLERMIAATPLDGFLAAAHALKSYDYTAVANAPGCPLLALYGDRDTAIAAGMQRDFGAVPGVRFAAVGDAGHLPNYERPEAFNAQLVAFLEEVDRQP